ncbi:MAG TPA: protein kinase [Ktedonobacteraceae bacterium]|nr:protein kinase [Ktedonobacteraceae bacterium]
MGMAGPSNICANCGTNNAPGEQFCANCGYALNSNTSQATIAGIPAGTTSGVGRRVTGALSANAILAGRYRIDRLVGKGGFGAVYRAYDDHFQAQRVVAIKELSEAQLAPQERASALEDFRREANLLVTLSHPNLPNVSDFFEDGGKAYLVMEFIEGRSLEKVQDDEGGPLNEEQVMAWALQLCDVLAYMHSRPKPVIFRDMKPSNVMLTVDDQIKLIDFGIARVFKSTSAKDTTLLGSQGYAPLEQYGRGQSDARSDIYALGATLYDLLTKTRPADAPMRRINPSLFQTPRQLQPNLSSATERIVLKAMENEPADRFQSASEMYQAILNSGVVTVNSNLRTVVTPQHLNSAGFAATTPQTYQGTSGGAKSPTLPGGIAPYPRTPLPPTPGSVPSQTSGSGKIPRRSFLIGGASIVALAAVGGTGLYAYEHNKSSNTTTGTSGAGTLSITFAYSTEKDNWMNTAIPAFNASNTVVDGKTVQVTGQSFASLDGRTKIIAGQLKPTAWCPASDLELNQLADAWSGKHNGQSILSSEQNLLPMSLVYSPLVFAVWADRAQILLQKYGSIDWPAVHSALAAPGGWKDLGGQANWGLVKFGQTRPDQSNSGLLTITLLAYSYFKTQRNLSLEQVNDPHFLQYFSDIEGAVQSFGRSSGTFLEKVVIQQGEAAYDIITTYENLVLTYQQEAIQRNNQMLKPFYPGLNIVSNHPFAILQTDWVNASEQKAAIAFRDFLLSPAQQRVALASGFRPSNPAVKMTDNVAGNVFLKQPAGLNIPANIQPLAQPPSGQVIDGLLSQWMTRYKDAATTSGG